jgi:hypothetical protein
MTQIPGTTQQIKSWWFIPNIKNSGNTPTKNMRYLVIATCPSNLQFGLAPKQAVDCNFVERGEPVDPEDDLKLFANNKPIPAIIGPQATAQLGGLGITESSFEAIKNGFHLYLFGVIYYNDIFPNSPLHITKYCYVIGILTSEKGELFPQPAFCDHWNCADDECKDDRNAWDKEVAEGKILKPVRPIPPPQ